MKPDRGYFEKEGAHAGRAQAEPLDARAERELRALERQGLRRSPRDGHPGACLDFASNDYLGLGRLRLKERLWPSLAEVPSGSGASRLVSGNHPELRLAEKELADWLGVDRILLFSSGYAAAQGVAGTLIRPGDTVYSDALVHASWIDGLRRAGADIVRFPHGDTDWLESALDRSDNGPLASDDARFREQAPTRWLVTESYFSMDADGPDLVRLGALCRAHRIHWILDEAHALGVFGPQGTGLARQHGVAPDILLGTGGKAFGLWGAFVGASEPVAELLWNRARSHVFSTGVSPLLGRALRHAIGEVAAERARAHLADRAAELRRLLSDVGLNPLGHGPIVPSLVGTPSDALRLAERLREAGIHVPAIRPPTVPAGTARLRFTASLVHDEGVWSEALGRIRNALGRATSTPALSAGQGRPVALPGSLSEGPSETPPAPPAEPLLIAMVGTGTGVGKTALSEALLRAWTGAPSHGFKPVETGIDPNAGADPLAEAADFARLAAAGTFHVKHSPFPTYAFEPPVSPHLAARWTNHTIELHPIVHAVLDRRSALAKAARAQIHSPTDVPTDPPLLVVETAGGLFSPLSNELANVDILGPIRADAVLLAAPNRLGTLHDVIATIRAADAAYAAIDAVVLVDTTAPQANARAPENTNPTELHRLLGRPVFRIPRVQAQDAAEALTREPALQQLLAWIRSRAVRAYAAKI